MALDRLVATVNSLHQRTADVSLKDPVTGVLQDNRLVLPMNPWKMRVYSNSVQSVADSAGPYTVNYDSVTYDSLNGFNASTHRYTLPVSGWYQVLVTVTAAPPGTASVPQLWSGFQRVGDANLLAESPVTWGPTGAPSMGATVNDIIYLNAGDVVYVKANPASSGTGNWFITPQSYQTFWAMHLVSG